MSDGFHPQYGKAGLVTVEGDAFDEPAQGLVSGQFRAPDRLRTFGVVPLIRTFSSSLRSNVAVWYQGLSQTQLCSAITVKAATSSKSGTESGTLQGLRAGSLRMLLLIMRVGSTPSVRRCSYPWLGIH